MINLLPPEHKESIIYARRNRTMIHWVFAFVLVLFAVILVTAAGNLYVNATSNNFWKDVKNSENRIESQDLTKSQKEAETFSNNLETVVSLLKDQLLFSKIITSVGAVLPSGTYLRDINFEATDVTIALDVVGVSEQAVNQAFINISSGENNLFAKADLVQIKCESDECTANIVALLKKDSEFYFLNNVKTEAKQ